MGEVRIRVRACAICGAVVVVATDDGGVDNEHAHREWHDRLEGRLEHLRIYALRADWPQTPPGPASAP